MYQYYCYQSPRIFDFRIRRKGIEIVKYKRNNVRIVCCQVTALFNA